MDKFNWDLILQEKTCVKIKNVKQFEKIKKEYKEKFGKNFFYAPANDCKYYQFSTGNIADGYRYWYRNNKEYFTANNYTILKYKDVRIKKENIVCERKETFQHWLKSDFNNVNTDSFTESFGDIGFGLLKHKTKLLFYSDKEYIDFLVEKIIIKCIEYYNNMYRDKTGRCIFYLSNEKIILPYFLPDKLRMKPSMIMNNKEVCDNVILEMTNFNGKNLLKYYFTGEF